MPHRTSFLASALLLCPALLLACGDDSSTGGAGGEGGTGAGTPLTCGDGFSDPDLGEECDDGNLDDTDTCHNDCTLPKCGDGVVQVGVEDCDDGNLDESDACLTSCFTATCGDGFIQAGVEACDDGNEEDADACTSSCQAGAGCGNGTVDEGEDCDDGNTSTADACIDCVAASCGDGHARIGFEQCDDGNAVDDDACANDCSVNPVKNFGCPGTPIVLAANGDVTLGGNTEEASPNYAGSCGGEESPEFVYELTTEAAGLLTIELLPDSDTNPDFDPILYVKSDCEGSTTLDCADEAFEGGLESLTLQSTAGATYYVFVDGYGGSAGNFLIAASHLTSVAGDNCPGLNIPIADFQDPYLVTGDTSLASAGIKGTGLCDSASTKDIVYKVVPPENGKLVAALDPEYDASLYVRTACTQPASQLACSEMGGVGALELINVPVTAGNAYYVVVDGKNGASGPFSIELTLLPP